MKGLKGAIRKLRVKRGDVLLVHVSLRGEIENLNIPELTFPVPVIFMDNPRNIKTITEKDVDRIKAMLQEQKGTK